MLPESSGRKILNVTIARLGYPCVGHGFRSTFRDWCGDHGVQRENAEAALGHVVPGVEGDYRRRDALTLRRQLMQNFVDQPWQDGANVIRIGSSVIRRHRPGCIAIKAYNIDNLLNCVYLNDPDRNVIRTDGDVRKPTEKDQVNTQVSA